MLSLVARFGDHVIRWPLPEDEARLGSAADNDYVLDARGVSRTHATLRRSGRTVLIADLDSKNGLLVGGERVKEHRLEPGGSVQIGRALLALEEVSTSDVELGLSVARSRRAEPGRDTAVSEGEAEGPLVVDALRFIREQEAKGDHFSGRRRQQFLEGARTILRASTLVLMHAGEEEAAAILNCAGQPPGEELMAAVREVPAKRRGVQGPVPIERNGWRFLVARKGVHVLCAGWDGGIGLAGVRDFFGYVGSKLLHVDGAGAPEAVPIVREALVAPAGMVLGDSPAVRSLVSQIAATVKSRLDVLLLGETGTGKELFAQMIHASGLTPGGPFVAINCAAIPGELLESELFGVHGRVATGVDPRRGLLLEANGGSILLDEIGDMPDRLQAKLLRVLQEREVLPLGASVPKKIDVRVISASNRDLFRLVEEGRFRRDLFYRLRGLQFHIPPLRDRKEDIPALVIEFIERAAAEYEKSVRGVSRSALSLLMEHDWPGNVRELEIEIRRAVLVCPEGAALLPDHLGTVRWMVERARSGAHAAPPAPEQASSPFLGPASPSVASPLREAAPVSHLSEPSAPATLQTRVDEVERAAIEDALRRHHGNRSAAARELGITRNGLAMKMARLGVG